MKGARRISFAVSLIIAAAGCTTLNDQKWVQQTKDVTVKAADSAVDTTSKSLKRMQRYLAEKDVLKTFHDAGEHSEVAVLEVLHRSKPKNGKTAAPASGTAAAAAASKGPHPTPATQVPQQYAGTLRWPVEAGIISSE